MKERKTLLITEETHALIKKYCEENNYKFNKCIDSFLREGIENLNK